MTRTRTALMYTVAMGGLHASLLVAMGTAHSNVHAASGPLRIHPDNPRYFTDGSGRAIYLTGSHTWLNMQDIVDIKGNADCHLPPAFDFGVFLDFLERYNHNFFRLWAWESTSWVLPDSTVVRLAPLPFARPGPGDARDGLPKVDPTQFNQAYFDRLRARVAEAGNRGIYVGVMLFQGFSVSRKSQRRKSTPWENHPFHRDNNTLGINGDTNNDGEGYEVHTLGNPAITTLQEAYVRKVIDTVGDLDNLIFEISNECHGESTQWHYHMIEFIHRYETSKLKQHPVWMSYQWDGIAGPGDSDNLFKSPAEIVSPSRDAVDKGDMRYREDPPAADGSKIIITDTDHLWGIGGDASWVWKSFLRGLHPVFMDPYHHSPHHRAAEPDVKWDPVRLSMGYTLRFAQRMNLACMTPRGDLASTGYCLANPGSEYLVYAPHGGEMEVDLSAVEGDLSVRWFDPTCDRSIDAARTQGGNPEQFSAPFLGQAVLHLVRDSGGQVNGHALDRIGTQWTPFFHATTGRGNRDKLASYVNEFVVKHGSTGFHVVMAGQWFDVDNVYRGKQNPDLRSYQVLEALIQRVHTQGGSLSSLDVAFRQTLIWSTGT